jgi:hypothetical protein
VQVSEQVGEQDVVDFALAARAQFDHFPDVRKMVVDVMPRDFASRFGFLQYRVVYTGQTAGLHGCLFVFGMWLLFRSFFEGLIFIDARLTRRAISWLRFGQYENPHALPHQITL